MTSAFIIVRDSGCNDIQQRFERLRNFAGMTGLHMMHEQVLHLHEDVMSALGFLFPYDIVLIDDLSALGTTQEEVSNLLGYLVNNGSLVVVVLSDDKFVVLDQRTVSVVEMFRHLDVTILHGAA